MASKKKLEVSFDPGYDSYKVVINGLLIQVPYSIESEEGIKKETLVSTNYSDDYIKICKKNENGTEIKSYLVGTAAKEYEAHKNRTDINKYKLQTSELEKYNHERFIIPEFMFGFEAVMGYAMIKYAEQLGITVEEVQTYEITIILEFPKQAVESYGDKTSADIATNHTFELLVGNSSTPIKFDFNIELDNVQYVAQVLCTVYNEMLNEKGDIVKDVTKSFPTLLIDGGYGTMVTAIVRQNFEIYEQELFSKNEYAMINVHKKASQKIKEQYGMDIKFYEIAHILKTGNTMRKGKNEKGVVTFDVKKIVEDCFKDVCKGFVEFVDQQYDGLLECNAAVIAGGTGAAYYDALKEYFVGEGKTFDEDSLYISNTTFLGNKVEPAFIIAIGGYKLLKYLAKNN